MNASELIRKVRRIQIRTSRITSEALSGNYHSAFRGRGIEFEKVRPYIVGDDIRSIDWNVSARVGSPHVKIFREERELLVMLAVDLSASQDFGTRGSLKRELVAEIAATIAFSAIRNGDTVGLMAFTDRIERFVPPRKGTRHVLRIVRELLALEAKGKGTRIAGAMDEVLGIVRKRSVLFVISDFQDSGWERSMAIARQRHDCIPVVVSDRSEQTLPKAGLIELEDPESGERFLIDTSDRGVRARFASLAAEERLKLQQTFRRLKMDPVEVETGGDFVRPLTEVFRRRESRRSR
ncbi:MAG: DUF58 domain-containing protein [Planctomycetes bacterium]|nr:DUF58 domain-containing protein [Planctomycetota bacterium]